MDIDESICLKNLGGKLSFVLMFQTQIYQWFHATNFSAKFVTMFVVVQKKKKIIIIQLCVSLMLCAFCEKSMNCFFSIIATKL